MGRVAYFNSIASFWIAHEAKRDAAIPKQCESDTSKTTQGSSGVVYVKLSLCSDRNRAAAVGC